MQEAIFNVISNHFNVSKDLLLSKLKKKPYNEARGILYYMLHYDAQLSIKTIAQMFNRRDRSIKKTIADYNFLINNQRKYINIYKKLRQNI